MKMLPKPTEKTGRAIVSAASTARPVFEVGLSVAGKGGLPVEPILGGFIHFKASFWSFFAEFCNLWHFYGILRYTIGHFW